MLTARLDLLDSCDAPLDHGLYWNDNEGCQRPTTLCAVPERFGRQGEACEEMPRRKEFPRDCLVNSLFTGFDRKRKAVCFNSMAFTWED